METGNILFNKKPWFIPNFNFKYSLFLRHAQNDDTDILPSSLSRDGNTLLIGSGEDRLAFDLRTRTPIKIGGALKSWEYPNAYCFLENDRVVAVNSTLPDHSGIFSFPESKRVSQVKLGVPYVNTTTGGDYVLTAGPKGSGRAIADVITGKYLAASQSPALDLAGQSLVTENIDGTLSLMKLGSDEAKDRVRASLSQSPLAAASSAGLSPNGRYLAFSERTRGTIWDLTMGKAIIVARGFRGSWWSDDGRLLAEFPAHDKEVNAISMLTTSPTHATNMTYKLPDKAFLSEGHLFEWKEQKNKTGWDFSASSPFDDSPQWTRNFPAGRVGFTTSLGDTNLIFSYPLQTPLASEKLRANGILRDQASLVKQKTAGRLIELVDSTNGSTLSQIVVEGPVSYEGVAGFNRVGDLL